MRALQAHKLTCVQMVFQHPAVPPSLMPPPKFSFSAVQDRFVTRSPLVSQKSVQTVGSSSSGLFCRCTQTRYGGRLRLPKGPRSRPMVGSHLGAVLPPMRSRILERSEERIEGLSASPSLRPNCANVHKQTSTPHIRHSRRNAQKRSVAHGKIRLDSFTWRQTSDGAERPGTPLRGGMPQHRGNTGGRGNRRNNMH